MTNEATEKGTELKPCPTCDCDGSIEGRRGRELEGRIRELEEALRDLTSKFFVFADGAVKDGDTRINPKSGANYEALIDAAFVARAALNPTESKVK